MLGYLDSNQEQLIVISAVAPTRNWGKMPQISAVFMNSFYALARTDTGQFWLRKGVFGAFLVTASSAPYTEIWATHRPKAAIDVSTRHIARYYEN